MTTYICSWCEREYKDGDRETVAYRNDRIEGGNVWVYVHPFQTNGLISHGICPQHERVFNEKIEMEMRE